MKQLLLTFLVAIAFVSLTLSSPVWAGDVGSGKAVFDANCAVCHLGGNNTVNPTKTLKQADLDAYGKNTIEAVITQVTNGAGAMPPFGGRLDPQQIENVATYVISQAEAGW